VLVLEDELLENIVEVLGVSQTINQEFIHLKDWITWVYLAKLFDML
jgi:hypothetical protein